MKPYKFIFIILLLLLLPSYSYGSTIGLMHINLIQGDVQIKTDDTLDWVAASINMPLKEGDRLWVPEEGRLEIRLQDGTFVRLDQNSGIELLTVEDGSYQFYLSYGRAYVNFMGESNSILQMDTPLSAIRTYDRSKFKIDVSDTGFTELSVISGAVYAESRSGQTRVSSGKSLSIGEDLYAELSPLGTSDEWERWNRERDNKLYSKRYSSDYLPTELHSYSYDFDYYGSWVNTTSYGYVWTPTFSLSVGWSPYSYGRWSWIGSDYVWISYQPWGWVPFHYGRWIWNVSFGWCWVPPHYGSVYWGPGYVGWYYTPSYVSWVPLGPSDIYYGYGYYGPHSTNMFKHKHHRNPIFYHHGHRRHAIMSVSRDSFLRGEYSRVALKENPFQKGVLTAGRPQITPEHATTRFLKKDISSHKRPPQMVRNLNAKELKNSRPFVTSRNKSVMKPETHSKKMTVRKVDRPTTLFARRDTARGSISQKQRQVHEKKLGVSTRTPEKQGISQRPFAEKQRADRKISSPAATMQKQTKKQGERKNVNRGYSGKQHNSTITRSFDRYQPFSKQKGSGTNVTKQYSKPGNPAVKRNSEKTAYSSKSRSVLQNSKKQKNRSSYTSRGSRTTPKTSRQVVHAPRITKQRSSGSYKSATPSKKGSQRTYVSPGNNRFYSGERSYRGSFSGSGYKSQPRAGFSRSPSRSPSMGSSRARSMGFGRR